MLFSYAAAEDELHFFIYQKDQQEVARVSLLLSELQGRGKTYLIRNMNETGNFQLNEYLNTPFAKRNFSKDGENMLFQNRLLEFLFNI